MVSDRVQIKVWSETIAVYFWSRELVFTSRDVVIMSVYSSGLRYRDYDVNKNYPNPKPSY